MFSGTRRIDKPGTPIPTLTPLQVRLEEHPWVSRGGIKLAHAFDKFELNAEGALAIDVGSSTGGFTEVLLHRGASRVYAVDVGYGQLDWKLRNDKRVQVVERTNARYLTRSHIPDLIDFVVCDCSFISLKKVLATPLDFVSAGGHLIALIKPQFEVKKHEVAQGGIVRDANLHRRVCSSIEQWIGDIPGWRVIGVEKSPLRGANGNTEFLIAAHLDV